MAGPADSLSSLVSSSEFAAAAAIGLGQVFAWSGVAKSLRPDQTAQALVDFRLTSLPSRTAARGLALYELLLAVLLLSSALAGDTFTGLALAIATLTAAMFVAAIAAALRRPARFACLCFGSSESPLSGATLARAGALLALSAAACGSAFARAEPMEARPWLLWNIVCGGVLSCLALLSRFPSLTRFDDPFDFSELAMIEPTGYGPISHDHDHE